MGASTPFETARGHEITIETQSSIPAGWYPDPAGTTGKRWWDGVQWSSHMQAPTPPPAPLPPAQQFVPNAVMQYQPQQIQPQPIQPQPSQPQPSHQQRVDPYAQASPYGLAPVAERPYVPFQQSSQPPVPMYQVHQAHNGAAISSVVVGAVAFCLSLVGFIPGSPVFYYSVGGIFAVIGGIRALSRRRRGFGTNAWAPVAAIILGSLAVILMIVGIAVHSTVNVNVNDSGSVSATQNQTGAGGSSSGTVPAPPTFATDAQLTEYEQTAATVAHDIDEFGNGGMAYSPDPSWPATVTVAADGTIVFPSGTSPGMLPAGEVMTYELSGDKQNFAIAVSGGARNEAALYDSESNSFTWTCATGDTSCPPGGIADDPGASSGSNT
jgi:hypothetical protein